jgi:hypothetical protein
MDNDYETIKENKVNTNYYIHNEMKDLTLKKTENIKENDYRGDDIKKDVSGNIFIFGNFSVPKFTIVHVAMEVIVICGIIYYFNQNISNLQNKVLNTQITETLQSNSKLQSKVSFIYYYHMADFFRNLFFN